MVLSEGSGNAALPRCPNSFFFADEDDDSVAYEFGSKITTEDTKNAGNGNHLSITTECEFLRFEIKLDLQSFDSMERDMALEMLKDKIELRRGLRGLAPLSPSVRRLTNDERLQALKYVKGRVKDLRQARLSKMAPTKAKQAVKRLSKLQKPAKHRLTKMAERKDVHPLRPSNRQPIANKACTTL